MAPTSSVLGPREQLARWIIRRSQRTRFQGGGGYSTESFAAKGDARPFPQADLERDHFTDFTRLFPAFDVCRLLADKDVLDLGSGYGGKTVEYKTRCGARRVCGVEPYPRMVDRAREYAASRNAAVEFEVCSQRDIPFAAASFDIVLSHDVLEHVEDPRVTLSEIHRVLRPGGWSFNVFPVYLGARSHHLDYVTTMPGLHWVFSPAVLVRAVNSILVEDPAFGTAPQPSPRRSFDGRREVLPGLNGLSGMHLDSLFGQFELLSLRRIAMGPRGMGLVVNSRLPTVLRDLATATVVCVLRKPAADVDRNQILA
jgi:SAM-dependent methyltransferase